MASQSPLVFDRFVAIAILTIICVKYATFVIAGFYSFGKVVTTTTFDKTTEGGGGDCRQKTRKTAASLPEISSVLVGLLPVLVGCGAFLPT
jgi:hypothetical protein